jgi:phage tail sheath gpL-like
VWRSILLRQGGRIATTTVSLSALRLCQSHRLNDGRTVREASQGDWKVEHLLAAHVAAAVALDAEPLDGARPIALF